MLKILSKDNLMKLMNVYKTNRELKRVLKGKMKQSKVKMNSAEMIQMLIDFDEIYNELGWAPDSDFVESLAYDTGSEPEEVDKFWKYLAFGDVNAEWD